MCPVTISTLLSLWDWLSAKVFPLGTGCTIHCSATFRNYLDLGRCDSPSLLSENRKPNNILGTFSTISSLDHGTPESRKAALFNGFYPMSLLVSFVLFFAALEAAKTSFGAELKSIIESNAQQQALQRLSWSKIAELIWIRPVHNTCTQATNASSAVAHLALVSWCSSVASLGGPTGPGLNPCSWPPDLTCPPFHLQKPFWVNTSSVLMLSILNVHCCYTKYPTAVLLFKTIQIST